MSAQFKSRPDRRGASLSGSSYMAEGQHWKPSIFDFKRSMYSRGADCPTCNGTGTIPKDHEDELVALIPYKDKRLKPQRLYLYVCASVLIVLILVTLATILMAIFYPRHVDLVVLGMNSTGFWQSAGVDARGAIVEVKIPLSLSNNNFFPVLVSKFDITLASMSNEVGSITLQPFSLSSRSKTPITVYQNASFKNNEVANFVQWICKNNVNLKIPFHLDIEMTYNYLSESYDTFVTNSSSVACTL